MKKLSWFILPLIIFLLLTVFLYKGLFSDPKSRDSALLERQFPKFNLPDLMDHGTRYSNDIFDKQVTLVNVWGIWCVTCAVELPYLTSLKQQGVRIVGLYYDQQLSPNGDPQTLSRVRLEVNDTLKKLGNPYQFNIFDIYRDTSLDLGVTGAPEHFLVDQHGVIVMHHIGDINERVWVNKVWPKMQALGVELKSGTTTLKQGDQTLDNKAVM